MNKDDAEKFEKFIKLLSEQDVEDFLNKLLLVGKFTDKNMTMFSDYNIYSAEILSQFSNPKINAEWKTFNASLNSLQEFIQEHHTLPNGFHAKHSVEWNKNIEELKKLSNDFEEKYISFVFLAKKTLETTDEEIKTGEEIQENGNFVIKTDIKNDIGFLFFHGEKIPLGHPQSGIFRLAESLCNNFGRAKNMESVFNIAKTNKDKNKTDNKLNDAYGRKYRILALLKGQIKEINREIKKYVKEKKLKKFNYRLLLKHNPANDSIWLKEKVG